MLPAQDGAAQRRVLVVHGFENVRPLGHWHRWLVRELRDLGEQVAYPQLPDPYAPSLDRWIDVLESELDLLADSARPVERVVVCHSLGCLLWLHAAHRGSGGRPLADRVLLVAPPGPSRADAFPSFAPVAFDRERVRRGAGQLTLVTSDADPWCPEGARGTYGEPLGLPTVVLPGTGHLDMESGFGPWPAVLEWCLTGDWPAAERSG